MAATVEGVFRIIDRASDPMLRMQRRAEALDRALIRAGLAGDTVGNQHQQRQLQMTEGSMRSFGSEADRTGQKMRALEQTTNSNASAWQRLKKSLGETGLALGGLQKLMAPLKLIAMGVAVGSLVKVIGVLGGGIIALMPKLVSLSGVAAGIGVTFVGMGIAMGTVKLAFSGVQQAMQGNLLAIKKLTPEAKLFVETLKSYSGITNQIRKDAQKGLFGGLDDALQRFKVAAPIIDKLAAGMGKTLGNLASQAANRFTTKGSLADLLAVGSAGTRGVGRLGTALINVGQGLLTLLRAAVPFTDTLTKSVEKMSVTFDKWATFESDSGRFGDFLNKTLASLRTFGDLLHNVWTILGNLGRAASATGDSLWQTADKTTARWAKLTGTIQEQVKLTRDFISMRAAFTQIVGLFDDLVGAVGKLGTDPTGGFAGMIQMLRGLVPTLVTIVNSLVMSFGPQMVAFLSAFGRTLSILLGATGPISILLTTITDIFKLVNGLVSAIPGLGRVIAAAFSVVAISLFMQKLSPLIASIRGLAAQWMGVAAAANTAAAAEARAASIGMGGIGGRAAVAGETTLASGLILPAGVVKGGAQGLEAEAAAGGAGLGLLGRGAAAGRGLLGAAGRFALPAEMILALYGGLTAPRGGSVGRQAGETVFGALNAATFGAIPKIPTPQGELASKAKLLLQGGTTGGGTGFAVEPGLLPTPYMYQTPKVYHRGLAQAIAGEGGQNPTTAGQVNAQIATYQSYLGRLSAITAGMSKQTIDQIMPTISAVKESLLALEQVHKRMLAMLSQRSRATAATNIRGLGAAYDIYAKKYGRAGALTRTDASFTSDLQHLSGPGRREEAQAYLSWAMEEQKKGKFSGAQVSGIKSDITSTYADLGKSVVISTNGKIVDSTISTWDRIRKEMKSKAEMAAEQTRSAFTGIQQQAVAALQAMGYTAGAADAAVQTLERKGSLGLYSSRQSLTLPFGGGTSSFWTDVPNRGATGLRVPGPRGAGDSVHALLAPGELVVNGHTEGRINRMLGGRATLGGEVARETRPQHMATGGRAGYPLGARGKLIGTPYQGTHAVAFNIAGGSNNWESENAIDLGTPTGTRVLAVAPGVIGSQIGSLGSGGRFAGLRLHLDTATNQFYYAHLSQLDVKAGQHVNAGQLLGLSGSANGVSHLHFAELNGSPMGYVNGAISSVMSPTSGPFGAGLAASAAPAGAGATPWLVSRGSDRIAKAAANRVSSALGELGSIPIAHAARATASAVASGVASGLSGGTSGSNQSLARRLMLAHGWDASQWPALKALWTQESGFRTTARNPSSGAYGIPQSLPASKMASAGADWLTNPTTQINWGLGYIGGRYGSPSAAWQHEKDVNWYGAGGHFRVKRPTLIGVGEKGEEEVKVTPVRRGRGGGSGAAVMVSIEKIEYNAPGDIAKVVKKEVEQAFRELGGDLGLDNFEGDPLL